MITEIIVALVSAFITWMIYSIIDKYIRIKPKLAITTRLNGLVRSAPNNQNAEFKFYNSDIHIVNNSPYDAYNLKFYYAFDKRKFHKFFENEKFTLVEKHGSIDFNFEIQDRLDISFKNEKTYEIIFTKILDKKKIVYRIILEYENSRGKKFYTYYNWNNGMETFKIKTKKPTF